MRIIEVKAFPNGGHRNQMGNFDFVPAGYAVIPENMETPNFPFGEVETKTIDGVLTVTKWTPGTIPETSKVENITTAERLAALEAAMLEMAMGGAE